MVILQELPPKSTPKTTPSQLKLSSVLFSLASCLGGATLATKPDGVVAEPVKPEREAELVEAACPPKAGPGEGKGAGATAGAARGGGGLCQKACDQLQVEFRKKGTLSGYMKKFDIAMIERADACTRKSSCPPAFNPLDAILGEPLKRRLPYLPVLIGVGSGRGRHTHIGAGTCSLFAFLGINESELIVAADIRDDRINTDRLNPLET